MSNRFGQQLKALALGLLLLTPIVVAAVQPAVARAEVPVVDTANMSTEELIAYEKAQMEKAQELGKKALSGVIFTGLINLLQFAADKAAYTIATKLVSGGAAGDPLVEFRDPQKLAVDYFESVGGEAVGLIAEDIISTGGILSNFNLCAPQDPQLLISFRLGVKAMFKTPQPLCEFATIKSNWQGFIAQNTQDFSSSSNFLKNDAVIFQLADAFNPQTQEFQAGIQLYSDILGKAKNDKDLALGKLLTQGPTKDVTDFITGNIKTPTEKIDYIQQGQTWSDIDKNHNFAGLLTSNAAAFEQVGLHAASMFANTLISSGIDLAFNGIFNPSIKDTADPFDAGLVALTNQETEQARFKALYTSVPFEVANYDALTDYATCPNTGNRGLYNCVMDTSFASAVASSAAGSPLTLADAIDQGLVNGNWALIPSSDKSRDQDPYCYTYGYCYSNLVKLRKARIISDGWELAANSTYNSESSPVTLQEVINGFDDCNAAGEPDASHNWCKMIDPNWILEYPDTTCKDMAYGELLDSSGSNTRQQNCVDAPSCISKDADGNCTGGYGYCVREDNVWQFRGDSCPDYASSCLSFTNSDGGTSSYLTNTVDYGTCNGDNAGCTWYAEDKTLQSDGTYAWPTVTDVAAADAATDTYQSRIYYNDNVATCDASAAGCTQLVNRSTKADGSDEVGLNLIPNSSFETDADANGLPDNWLTANATALSYSTDETKQLNGKAAVEAKSGLLYQSGIVLQQGSFYTLSYYARLNDASQTSATTADMQISLSPDDGETLSLKGTSFSSGCNIFVNNDGSEADDVMQLKGSLTLGSTDYQRFTCTFTAPTLADPAATIRAYVDVGGDGNDHEVWLDEIQLEQAEQVTDWHDAYSASTLAYTYANVPPTYLGCTGSDSDAADCANYSTVCQEQDVGCTEYTPANGDPAVFGVTSSLDTCPASCDGYDSYKQEATLYEPDGDFPVYFIPASATTCNAADAGCDEFTKLDDESLNYYTYLRACLTPDQASANTNGDKSATYYTWEGSDATGYQLVTWTLLESDLDAYTSSTYTTSLGVETNPGKAPCTTWTTSDSGVTCNDNADGDTAGHFDTDSSTCDEHADIFTNPDCREFYDTAGDIHYRLWSKTVTVNAACASYRKTDLVGLNVDSNGDGVADNLKAEANCTNSGGFYDSTTSECIYYGYNDESTTCSAAANGCRDYTGGRSANSRVALSDTMESGDNTAWDSTSAANVTYSNESVATDGHSLSSLGQSVWTFMGGSATTCAETTDGAGCAESAVALGGTCTVVNGGNYCGTLQDELYTGKTYTLSFWAKGTGKLTAGFDIDSTFSSSTPASLGTGDATFGTATLSASDWQQYSLGPLNMTAEQYADFGNGTVLVFAPDSSTSRFYLDNVTLREGEDSIDVIKNSWTTPAECDETPEGAASPQYYLGCQQYTSQLGDTSYEKSFSSLCSEKKVGCSAYYSTAQTTSAYGQVYGLTCSTLNGATVSTATNCYYGVDSTDSTKYDTSSQFLCTIGVGFDSCSADIDWNIPADQLPSHLSYGPSAHVVPADAPVYLIVGDSNTCSSGDMGCEEVGLPTFSQDHSQVTASTSTYLINSPADYGTTLCSQDDLFCKAWDAGDKGTYYFKDPGSQSCEYRTGVTVGSTSYDGWFRTGTDNFCYGSGTCATSGASCTTDAECGDGDSCTITAGSYLVGGDQSGIWRNGDANYNNWVGTCDAGYSTCSEFQDLLQIPDGHLYGESDGTSYFYLDNSSMSEDGLISGEKCNGQVSQKSGCVLFNDTAETAQTYNASASYIASLHADSLFGDKPDALENPISCTDATTSAVTTPAGDSVDLCASRCAYGKAALEDSTNANAGETIGQMLLDNSTAGTPLTRDDLYTFGGSCVDNSDCPLQASDFGEKIPGTCQSTVTITENVTTLAPVTTDSVPRLSDDSNRVVKVDRDRQCSEWLSCADSQQVWDERTGTYRTICGDIDLCNAYSGSGDASFCSSWVQDDTATILDTTRYTDRDTSWYGHDYSGYAIPGMLPVQMLSQVNITPPPNFCVLPSSADTIQKSLYQGKACTTDGDCGLATGAYCATDTATDYRLVFDAGSCSESYGESCTVGYCSDTASACSSDDQCSSNSCIIGTCYNVGTTDCQTAETDCPAGDVCLTSGKCATEGDDSGTAGDGHLNVGGTCASGETLYADLNDKTGTCINSSCLLTPEGAPIDTGTTEAKDCRAYPESSSPFDNEIVSAWEDPDPTEAPNDAANSRKTTFSDITSYLTSAPDMVPYSFITGFDKANVCAAGENCTCSYKKVTYGSGVNTTYIAPDTSVEQAHGICSGGGFDGAACSKNDSGTGVISEAMCERGLTADGTTPGPDDTTTSLNGTGDVKGGGTCNYPTQEDTVLGLDGYCLERDTATNIDGNRDDAHRACLTWLPVDQLAGSTDLYAKDLSAGYFQDTSVCAYTDMYVDLGPSLIPDATTLSSGVVEGADINPMIACANADVGDVATSEVYKSKMMDNCADNAVCPSGYWTLVGQAEWKNDTSGIGHMADACIYGGNDCPYACIPYGATDANGDSCNPDDTVTTNEFATDGVTYNVSTFSKFGTNDSVYSVGKTMDNDTDLDGFSMFDKMAETLKGCRVRGIKYDDTFARQALGVDEGGLEINGFTYRNLVTGRKVDDTTGLTSLVSNVDFYPACAEVLKVVDGTNNIGYPFTDKLKNSNSSFTAISDDTYASMDYTTNTTPQFGVITSDLSTRVPTDAPVVAAACVTPGYSDGTGTALYPPSNTNDLNSCDTTGSAQEYADVPATSPSASEGRSFIPFSLKLGQSNEGTTGNVATRADSWTTYTTIDDVFGRINQLFAGVDNSKKNGLSLWGTDWSSTSGGENVGYQAGSDDTGTYNYTDPKYDVRASQGNAPKVWALSNSTCNGTECEEGDENALTLNDQNSGQVEGTGGFYRAYLKFYAAADKNQLPLRRVIVDWGDGKLSGATDAGDFYKNHRGLQPGTTTSICSTASDGSDPNYEWGMNSDSCDPNYFSYNHNYTCNDGLIASIAANTSEGYCADANNDGINDTSPCIATTDEGSFCVFTPKVHVRDNWGWCTGTCNSTIDDSYDNSSGCFEGGVDSLNNPGSSASECAYTEYTGATANSSGIDPWVHYDGAVYVKP